MGDAPLASPVSKKRGQMRLTLDTVADGVGSTRLVPSQCSTPRRDSLPARFARGFCRARDLWKNKMADKKRGEDKAVENVKDDRDVDAVAEQMADATLKKVCLVSQKAAPKSLLLFVVP
jgi:hypothetical protein